MSEGLHIVERLTAAVALAAVGGAALAGCTSDRGDSPDFHLPPVKPTSSYAESYVLPAGTNIYEDYEGGKLVGWCARLDQPVELGDHYDAGNGVVEFLYNQPPVQEAIGKACESTRKELFAKPLENTTGAPQP